MDPYYNQAYREMLIDRALREQMQRRANRLLPRDWRRDQRLAAEVPNQQAFDPRLNR